MLKSREVNEYETFVEVPGDKHDELRKEVADAFVPVANEKMFWFCSSVRNGEERLLVTEPLHESVYDRSYALLVETPTEVRYTKIFYDLGSLASIKWRLDPSGLYVRTNGEDGTPKPYGTPTGDEADYTCSDIRSIRFTRSKLSQEHLPVELQGVDRLIERLDDPSAQAAVHGIIEQNNKIKEARESLEQMLWAQPENTNEAQE